MSKFSSPAGPRRALRASAAALAVAGVAAFAWPALSGAHGDDEHAGHGGSTKPPPADADRCDLGFNTKAYNDAIKAGKQTELTPTWSQTFRGKDPAYDQLSLADKVAYNAVSFMTNEAYRGMQVSGHDGHPLVDPWEGITDPVACAELKGQLEDVMAAVRKYPTLGDAERAGYGKRTPYFAGSGVHMVLKGVEDDPSYEADTKVPPSLLYDGINKGSAVVGAMFGYETTRGMDTDIFAGNNGTWHQHQGLCYSTGLNWMGPNMTKFVIGSEASTEKGCKKRGGEKELAATTYMMHVWVVPGCENPLGLFAHDNPKLTNLLSVRTARKGNSGCGTGKTVNDPLAMETNELNVPGALTTYQPSSLRWWQGNQRLHSGNVRAKLADHPGSAHAGGELHLAGTLETDTGFAGTTGSWPISFLRETDGTIHGSLTTPAGTVATFPSATATRSDRGVLVSAWAKVPGGASVSLAIEIADPGQRAWFLDPVPVASDAETFAIHHPAHGHDHAAGPVTYALENHPGSAHAANEEHLFGTATTKDGFTGDSGSWTISFVKNTDTHAITGYVKNPGASKTFNFTVADHHESDECSGGVHVNAAGAEAATPTDPQNPEFIICDPAVTTFFADHDHSGTAGTTPVATTPGHEH